MTATPSNWWRIPTSRSCTPGKGLSDTVIYDEAGIVERYGVPAASYAVLAALRGDPSDNLAGVPGVGEKTAAKLVSPTATSTRSSPISVTRPRSSGRTWPSTRTGFAATPR